MTAIDISIIVVVAAGGLLGLRDGLFRKILAIVSFIVGIIAATKLMGPLGGAMAESVGLSIEISYVVAFFLVFAGFVLLHNIIYRIVGDLNGEKKSVNRIGGTVLGLLQGTLAASLILVMLSIFELPSDSTRKNSPLYKPFLNFAPRLFDLSIRIVPESKTFYQELKKDLARYKIDAI